jgi:structural maintenance of chromosome 2
LCVCVFRTKCDEAGEARLVAQRQALETQVRALSGQVESLASRLTEFELDLSEADRSLDRSKIKGLVAQLIEVKEAKYATALEVTAGGRLYNVVVDTEQVRLGSARRCVVSTSSSSS